ncbi:TIGR02594 family protein [Sinorhizobium meliloti]|uniref:TIGR02594 family protein n=1 Tax=Rhizobium meliloti TaxID=382 RepID=UPI001F1C1753|nr:TIGR02594 family protein [Sinorhizobium meliloti]
MPRVPEYQPNVSTRPIHQQGIDVRATPEAFGAAIGRGMQSAARGVAQVSDAMAQVQALEDEANVRRARNEYLREKDSLLYDPDKGYLQKQGKDAIDGIADYERGLEDLRRRHTSKLTPNQQQLFTQAVEPLEIDARRSGLIHKGNALRAFVVEELDSSVEAFGNQALLNFSNPAQVSKYIAAGQLELRRKGDLQGWGAETLQLRESEFVSGVYRNVALRIAQDDPLRADEYVKKIGDGLSPRDQVTLTEALREPILAAKANRTVQETLAGIPTQNFDDDDQALPDPPLREGQKVPSIMDRAPVAGPQSFQAVTKQVLGMNEKADAGVISDFIKRSAGINIDPRVTPWCAAFVNAVLGAQGIEGTGKLNARSFLNFGMPTDAPKPGDIVVMSRGSGAQGHVGFFQGYDANGNILVLGGNQSNSVKVSAYGIDRLLGFRTAGNVNEQTAKLPNYNPVGLGAIYDRLSKITDPKEYEATRKAFDAQLTLRKKAMDAQQEQVKSWAEAQVAADPSLDLMKLPAEIRTAIGASGMTTLLNYQEKVRTSGEPVTDDRTLYDLQMMDPDELAETDLFQFRDKLSNSDWEKVRGWKQSALGDKRKAKDEHLNITAAANQATDNLRAVGLVKSPSDMSEADHKRVAQFNNSLTILMDEFKTENKRVPSQVEVQSLINRLLLPAIIKTPGALWGTNDTRGFMFETAMRPEGSEVNVAVEYADIPVDLRRGITLDLERELGRQPYTDEVVMRYEDFVLGRGPMPIPERVTSKPEDELPNRLLRPFAYIPGKALSGLGQAVDWVSTVPKNEPGVDREEALDRFLDGDPLTGR